MKKPIRTILLALLAILLILQIFQIDKTNPPSDPAQDFVSLENPPPAVAETLKNACYDCHSNQTAYPWYTSIQPVGWWVQGHYRGARNELNFSEWKNYPAEDKPKTFREVAEEVEEKEMPLKSYTWMHPEGKLSDTQRTELAAWFRTQAGGGSGSGSGAVEQGAGQVSEHGEEDGHEH